MQTRFRRHIDLCNSASPPYDRQEFALGDTPVGWVTSDFAEALTRQSRISRTQTGLRLADPAGLHALARTMSDQGHYRFRREAFDVRAHPAGPKLATIDRGALPAFGIAAQGIHLNGLVRKPSGLHVWVARRAANKMLDPGKLDHLVAGGVSAGMAAAETLLKEAAEEAAVPHDLVAGAVKRAEIAYAMLRPEGLRRDLLHCYDLELPASFEPQAADGEVEAFELWPIERVFKTVRDTDDFKFNVNLVLIDLFQRLGMSMD